MKKKNSLARQSYSCLTTQRMDIKDDKPNERTHRNSCSGKPTAIVIWRTLTVIRRGYGYVSNCVSDLYVQLFNAVISHRIYHFAICPSVALRGTTMCIVVCVVERLAIANSSKLKYGVFYVKHKLHGWSLYILQ